MTSTIYVEHVIVNDVSSPPKIEVNFESMQCVTNINSNLRLPNHPDFAWKSRILTNMRLG